jgi:hypothetical protein
MFKYYKKFFIGALIVSNLQVKQQCVSNNFIANDDEQEKIARDFISKRTDGE